MYQKSKTVLLYKYDDWQKRQRNNGDGNSGREFLLRLRMRNRQRLRSLCGLWRELNDDWKSLRSNSWDEGIDDGLSVHRNRGMLLLLDEANVCRKADGKWTGIREVRSYGFRFWFLPSLHLSGSQGPFRQDWKVELMSDTEDMPCSACGGKQEWANVLPMAMRKSANLVTNSST